MTITLRITSNTVTLTDGAQTFISDPATQTIKLQDGIIFGITHDEATNTIALEEVHTRSDEAVTVQVDGRIYVVTVDPNDPKHRFRFTDGFGTYVSVQDAYGFYQDGETVYSKPDFYGENQAEGRENYENFAADTIFLCV